MTANTGFPNGSRAIRLTFPIQRDHASTMLDATWSIFHVLEEGQGLVLTHCTKRLRVYVMALDDGRSDLSIVRIEANDLIFREQAAIRHFLKSFSKSRQP